MRIDKNAAGALLSYRQQLIDHGISLDPINDVDKSVRYLKLAQLLMNYIDTEEAAGKEVLSPKLMPIENIKKYANLIIDTLEGNT
jgi:hypothetical protein